MVTHAVACHVPLASYSDNSHAAMLLLTCSVLAVICINMSSDCVEWVVKVQTIKTSVESAIMLLRIDDIVSGISKKSRGGGGQPSGTQTEDHDNVSISVFCFFSHCYSMCIHAWR